MVSELGQVEGHGFEPPLCIRGYGACMHMSEGVKNHDIYIKLKSYKLKLFGELVV